MLIWKMQNTDLELTSSNTIELTGRDEELWRDFLTLTQDTKYFDDATKVVDYFIKQRHDSISSSIDARIFASLLNNLKYENKVYFEEFWNKIIANQEPEIQVELEGKGQTYTDADTGEKISKPILARKLSEKFHGKKISITENTDGFQKRKTYYKFDYEELQKLSKKYDKPFKATVTTLG